MRLLGTWHRGGGRAVAQLRSEHRVPVTGDSRPTQLKQRTLFTSRLARQLLQLRAHRRQRDANSLRDPRRAAFAQGAKHTHL